MRAFLTVAGVIFLAIILIRPTSGAEIKGDSSMELRSSAFQNGGEIPRQYSCDGNDVSPPLRWENIPAATKAFALIADDPDAPGGTWVHWVIYDLPPETKEFGEGVATTETVPNGGKQGVNDFRKVGYGGPCPPQERPTATSSNSMLWMRRPI